MRFKRAKLGFILVILILLSVRLVKGYMDDVAAKENREKIIEELNRKFDCEINQPQPTRQLIFKSVDTDNKRVKTDSENVIGKIVINKIDLNYPILEGSTKENLNISITRFYGSKINTIGNCVLAGHNLKDGSLFGRISELSENDKIILYDNLGKSKEYKIFSIKIVKPTDLSVLSQNTNNSCFVTLITCTNQGKSRLIVQAKQI
ncbi:sortase [Clostridium thailandense]|uniref:sortase n=1 Tax=Clostridium thailandense TaxID=2794346 RepID=UPI003989D099